MPLDVAHEGTANQANKSITVKPLNVVSQRIPACGGLLQGSGEGPVEEGPANHNRSDTAALDQIGDSDGLSELAALPVSSSDGNFRNL